MKRILYLILIIMALVLTLASCKAGGDGSDGSSSGDNGTGDTDGSGDNQQGQTQTIWSSDITSVIVSADGSDESATDLYYHIGTLTGKKPTIVGVNSDEAKNEILIGDTGRALSDKAYKRLDRLYDLFELKNNGESAYIIYASGGSLAIAYSDIYAKAAAVEYVEANLKSATYTASGTVAHQSFKTVDFIADKREEGRALGYANIERILGADAAEQVRQLYSLYDEGLYIWLANLYDPTYGGFYYSGSARNTEGFLPDLESTAQGLALLDNSGVSDYYGGSWANLLTDEMKAQMLSFVYDMQSPDDYYYYHPQWGTAIGSSRRGRDAGWAKNILEGLGQPPKYSKPQSTSASLLTGRLGASAAVSVSKVVSVASVADELSSESAFRAYLDAANISENSYSTFNNLNARVSEIKNAGLWDFLLNYLIEHQYPNGLWEPTVSYQSVNGLMKVSSFFNSTTPFPNAAKAIESAIRVISMSDASQIEGIVYIYNPWVAVKNLLPYCSASDKEYYKSILTENAASLFAETYQKLVLFKRDDGGFSYKQTGSAHVSQDVTVAVEGTKESDVNATTIAISTVLRYILQVYDNVNPPALYYKYDTLYFCETLHAMGKVVKDEALADPEVVTFDNYNSAFGNEEGGVVLQPDDIVVNNVGDMDMQNGVYIWFSSQIVPNPAENAKESDLVLNVKDFIYPDSSYKEIADKQSSTEIAITNYTAVGNCFVFESDIWYVGDGDASAPAMQLMFGGSGGNSTMAWLNFYPYEHEGETYLRIVDEWEGSDGYENTAVVGEIPTGKWFNLRIELYKETDSKTGKLDVKMKIYVDDKYAGESNSCSYTNGAYANYTVNSVRLTYYRHTVSEFYLNNMYAARTVKTYRSESAELAQISYPSSYDFEGEAVANGINGYTYSTQSAANGRETYRQTTVNSSEMPDGRYGAWFSLVSDPENAENQVLKIHSNNAKSATAGSVSLSPTVLRNGKVHIIEYDYYLDSNTTSGASMLQLRFINAVGTKLGGDATVAYGIVSSDSYDRGMFQIGTTSTTVDGISTLDPKCWYRIRIAWDQASGILRYSYSVDGGASWYSAAADGERKSTFEVAAVQLICNTYNTVGVQYIDNLSYKVTDDLPEAQAGVPDTGYTPIVTPGGQAVYDFETDALLSGANVDIKGTVFLTAPSNKNYNEDTDRVNYTSITEDASRDGLYGVSMRIAKDVTNDANKVLRMQFVHSGSLKNTVLTVAASQANSAHKINVLEFDYYLDYQIKTGSTTPFKIQFNDENDRMIGTSFNFIQALANPVAAKENEEAKKAFLANGVGLKSKTWYKIRVIWNQNEGTRDFYYSLDNGATFIKLGETAKNASTKYAPSVSLIFSAYNWDGVQQLDNISYKIVESLPQMNIKELTPAEMGAVAVGGNAVYDFETDALLSGANASVEGYVYSASDLSNAYTVSYDKITASGDYDGNGGVSLSIAADLTSSANKVLRAVTKSTSALQSTYLTIAASRREKDGKINVLEFDYYLYSQTEASTATPLKFNFNNYNGDSIGAASDLIKTLPTPVSAKDYEDAKKAFVINGVGLNTKTWYKIRMVWNQNTGERDLYYSTDNGASFVKLGETLEATSVVEAHSVSLIFSAKNWTGVQQLDNISYKVLKEAPAMKIRVPSAAELGTVVPGGDAVYDFETDAMMSGKYIVIDAHAYEQSPSSSNTNYNHSEHHYGYNSIGTSGTLDGKYGVSLSIVTDSTSAANKVLKIQTKATGGSANTNLTIAAGSIEEGGAVSVLEFDYRLLWQTNTGSATPFKFWYNNEAGDSVGSAENFIKGIQVSAKEGDAAKEAFVYNGVNLESQTWYRIRIVLDSVADTISYYYSYDGGATYLKAGGDVSKTIDAEVKSVTLSLSAYNWEGVQYIDNLSFKVVTKAPDYVEGTKPQNPVEPEIPEEPDLPDQPDEETDNEGIGEGNVDSGAWD